MVHGLEQIKKQNADACLGACLVDQSLGEELLAEIFGWRAPRFLVGWWIFQINSNPREWFASKTKPEFKNGLAGNTTNPVSITALAEFGLCDFPPVIDLPTEKTLVYIPAFSVSFNHGTAEKPDWQKINSLGPIEIDWDGLKRTSDAQDFKG